MGPSVPADERSAYQRIVSLLERLGASEDAVIAEHARWALHRLRDTTV